MRDHALCRRSQLRPSRPEPVRQQGRGPAEAIGRALHHPARQFQQGAEAQDPLLRGRREAHGGFRPSCVFTSKRRTASISTRGSRWPSAARPGRSRSSPRIISIGRCSTHAGWIAPTSTRDRACSSTPCRRRSARWCIAMVKRSVKKNMWGHGFGRHTKAEIETLGMRDLDAIAAFIGDKPWLMGDSPAAPTPRCGR